MMRQSLHTSTVPVTPMDNRQRGTRLVIYQGIARLIWVQYALEQNIPYNGFDGAPADFKKALLDAAEVFANMALDPDLRDTALMCMADSLVDGNSGGTLTISDVSKQSAQQYLTTAEAALGAFFMNLRTIPPDSQHREEMCRVLDAIAPKKGVN